MNRHDKHFGVMKVDDTTTKLFWDGVFIGLAIPAEYGKYFALDTNGLTLMHKPANTRRMRFASMYDAARELVR